MMLTCHFTIIQGIMYDTGGLSIKTPTTSMAGMKTDMGGSAAVLCAFQAAVKSGAANVILTSSTPFQFSLFSSHTYASIKLYFSS